jgi:hypothetical protein
MEYYGLPNNYEMNAESNKLLYQWRIQLLQRIFDTVSV